jgi:hypothetical protein
MQNIEDKIRFLCFTHPLWTWYSRLLWWEWGWAWRAAAEEAIRAKHQ